MVTFRSSHWFIIFLQTKSVKIMVKLKFIVREGALVLRISENKARFYKSVKHLFIGQPNVAKHWIADKERFSPYAVSYQENNKALEDFKAIYRNLVTAHPEYTARQVACAYTHVQTIKQQADANLMEVNTAAIFFEQYLEVVIEREKAKQGCNFEVYEKLLRKCRKLIPDFCLLKFQDITYDKLVYIAGIFAEHPGFRGTTKAFRAVLGRASKDKAVDFSVSSINDFNFQDYNPEKYDVLLHKPDVLSPDKMKEFLNLDTWNLTPQYDDRELVELYYDFCVFMFQSFFAPCDVIKLKYAHITKSNTIVTRRKKTHRAIEIPITPKMEAIINKYKGQTVNGYVLPIMDDEKAKEHKTKDYIFKKFRQKLNVWLKDVGEELKLDFDLYAYVFRHTAITVALDNGLPISYVAAAAGTSIEMIQNHYYNSDNIANSQRLQLAFIKAGM